MKIKKGDQFKVTSRGHIWADRILTVTKVENLESNDGYVHFDLDEGVGNRNKKYNHRARVWWFKGFCTRIEKST